MWHCCQLQNDWEDVMRNVALHLMSRSRSVLQVKKKRGKKGNPPENENIVLIIILVIAVAKV